MIKNLLYKSADQISAEWDALAPVRLQQIISGRDITFNHVLSPLIHQLVQVEDSGPVLDLGCGVGVLTQELSRNNRKVIGIDPSQVSISLAQSAFGQDAEFICSSAEQYAVTTKKRFSVIVANMVLMDAVDLAGVVAAVANLLRRGGVFIFSITHPCFWPSYYGYENEPWFDYSKELIIEGPFRITGQQDCQLNSTHIHRPIESYISAISRAGLNLDGFFEPIPDDNVSALYPSTWREPRYVVGRCRLPRRIRTTE